MSRPHSTTWRRLTATHSRGVVVVGADCSSVVLELQTWDAMDEEYSPPKAGGMLTAVVSWVLSSDVRYGMCGIQVLCELCSSTHPRALSLTRLTVSRVWLPQRRTQCRR